MTTAPVLALPDPNLPFTVTTDALDKAIIAVLTQDQGCGDQPLAFLLRKLNLAELNYPIHKKELLAIIHALKTWRIYLEGRPFTVITDHAALEYLPTQPKLSRRQARWMELLQSYDFVTRYRPGKTNIADPMTRKPEFNLTATSLNVNAIMLQLADSYKTDKYFGPIYHALTQLQGQIDSKIRTQIGRYQVNDQVLFLKKAPHEERAQLCIPDKMEMRNKILQDHHDADIAGHRGVDKTYLNIAAHFFWPKLSKDIKSYIASCDACQRNKSSTRKPAGLLQPLPTPESRWEQVLMDFIVQLPKTKTGMTAILVVVDRLSKRAHFLPTSTEVTAPEVAKLFFNQIF
jgi:hypothetical protein